jgi:hypothetical protein
MRPASDATNDSRKRLPTKTEDCRPAREAKAAVKLGFAAGGAHEGKRKTKSFFSFLFFFFSRQFSIHLSL